MSRLNAIQQLLEQDPANSRIRYMLAMEYSSAGRFPDAAAALGELIDRDAAFVAAYYQAGHASEQAGNLDAARDFYRRGIDAARRAGDVHAQSELQAALDILG